MKDTIVIGVDIGGSHITSAFVDLEKGMILDQTLRRTALNTQGEAEEIISSWCTVIQETCIGQDVIPSKIGLAIPGPFKYVEGISLMKDQNKYDALYGMNIKYILAERLSLFTDDIIFSNDAACFLQGEVLGGAAKRRQRVIGLTLGTGFGSSKYFNDIAVDADLWCSSFKDGIAEDYLSTRWFVRRYYELAKRIVKDVRELMNTKDDNACVQQIFKEFGRNLGDFLLPHVQQDALDTVVIGGNIANSFNYFSTELKRVFEQNHVLTEVKQAQLGENAALLGAASYCVGSSVRQVISPQPPIPKYSILFE